MFALESEMLSPVKNWISGRGLDVKSEYDTPWGICDVVGCKIDAEKAVHRKRLGQVQSVGSLFRVELLRRIPDIETGKTINLNELNEEVGDLLEISELQEHISILRRRNFVVDSNGEFSKRNGWMPLHSKVVSVEMKLKKFPEVLAQAVANLSLTSESYIAMPEPEALKIASKNQERLRTSGIGMLAVGPTEVFELVAPSQEASSDKTITAYCAERFWRNYVTNSSS
jgi:hypothetical protein